MLKYLIQKEAKISVDGVYDCCNINPKWTPKDPKMEPKRTKNGPKTDLKWSIVKIRSFEPKRHLTNFLLILYFYGFSAMKPPSFLWFDHQRDGF